MEVTEEKVTSSAETPGQPSNEEEANGASPSGAPDNEQQEESQGSDRRVAGQKKVVKKLAVGQQVRGKVKRVADFGAFVDIGVGRDGLVHISEMSYNRVNKVSDVVSEGQEVDVWIKELDRDRNRISLTMRKPPEVNITELQADTTVRGTITRIVNYGAFVDIGTGREALLHVREMAEGFVKNPSDIVSVGQELELKVLKVDPKTRQVDLSLKVLLPKEERAPQAAQVEEAESDEAEEAVPTAMEVALREALSSEAKEPRWVTRRREERRRKDARRRDQDDILTRTLTQHRKWEEAE